MRFRREMREREIHCISLSTWDLGLEEIRAISDFALQTIFHKHTYIQTTSRYNRFRAVSDSVLSDIYCITEIKPKRPYIGRPYNRNPVYFICISASFRSLVDASWCEGDNTNLLASGSADGFVKVWDTRSAEGRPVASLFSMTAVSHVQWRRQSNHSVASTHGGDVRLWDIREGICKRQTPL